MWELVIHRNKKTVNKNNSLCTDWYFVDYSQFPEDILDYT